ncbi:beta-ketoacyl-acyl-carrier-protein synthase II [mine drainage metagenome]
MAEACGLRQVFENLPPVTVLKPYLGHTLGACCVNELVLFASALLHRFIPATPGFKTTDPELNIHPLTVEMPAQTGHYLLNHFGFAGNNTVLILEKTA